MIRGIDHFESGTVTLERQDVDTARHLLDQLAVLVGGVPLQSGNAAQARHDLACQILESRRSRAAHFADDMFDEPAWDILLQLYCTSDRPEVMAAHALGHSISSPRSTIERWVKILIERDLVENVNPTGKVDPGIRLSGNGIARLDAYFQILLEHQFQV